MLKWGNLEINALRSSHYYYNELDFFIKFTCHGICLLWLARFYPCSLQTGAKRMWLLPPQLPMCGMFLRRSLVSVRQDIELWTVVCVIEMQVMIEHPNYIAGAELYRRTQKDPFFRTDEKSQFSPDITPLILAAHYNNHEIIQMFLSRNQTIDRPHPISCQCADCVTKQVVIWILTEISRFISHLLIAHKTCRCAMTEQCGRLMIISRVWHLTPTANCISSKTSKANTIRC